LEKGKNGEGIYKRGMEGGFCKKVEVRKKENERNKEDAMEILNSHYKEVVAVILENNIRNQYKRYFALF